MKIIGLQTKNVKKIKVIDITPDDNMVQITGPNGTGKSSVLDSILMALGGESLIPAKPVREGEKTASIDVDLGEYKVSRHWTNPETSYLKIKTADGAKISNPQKVLTNIIGKLGFDPMAFVTMKPDKRLEIVKELTGLDFTHLDSERAEAYAKRRDAKRDLLKEKTKLEAMQVNLPALPTGLITLDDVQEKRNDAERHNNQIRDAIKKLLDDKEYLLEHEKRLADAQLTVEKIT